MLAVPSGVWPLPVAPPGPSSLPLSTIPSVAVAVDTEIGWAKANCLTAASYVAWRRRPPAGRTPSPPSTGWPRPSVPTRTRWGAPAHARPRRRPASIRRSPPPGRPSSPRRVHWRYRHLSVDEFQDVNPAQFRLILALAGLAGGTCARSATRTRPSTDGTGRTRACSASLPDRDTRARGRAPGPGTTAAPPRSWPRPRPPSGRPRWPPPSLGDRGTARPPRSPPSPTTGPRPRRWPPGSCARAEAGTAWSDQAVLARTHDLLAGGPPGTRRRRGSRAGSRPPPSR